MRLFFQLILVLFLFSAFTLDEIHEKELKRLEENSTLGSKEKDEIDLWNELYKRVVSLCAANKCQEAVPIAEEALELSEETNGPNDPLTGFSLSVLAWTYDNQNQFEKAETYYKQALTVLEKSLKPADYRIIYVLTNLGNLYKIRYDRENAESYYRKALTAIIKSEDQDVLQAARLMTALADIYDYQNRYEPAEDFYKESLEIREEVLEPNHPDVTQSINNLAKFYKTQGKYNDALLLYKRAFEINKESLGSKHSETAASMGHLADMYKALHRYNEAISYYEKASVIWEKALGPDNAHKADALEKMADIYRFTNQKDKALKLKEQAKKIRISLNGVIQCSDVKGEGWRYKKGRERWLGSDPTFSYNHYFDRIKVTHYGLESSRYETPEQYIAHLRNLFGEFKILQTKDIMGKKAELIRIEYDYPEHTGHHGEYVPHEFVYEEFIILPVQEGFLVFNFNIHSIVPMPLSIFTREKAESEWEEKQLQNIKVWRKFLKSCKVK